MRGRGIQRLNNVAVLPRSGSTFEITALERTDENGQVMFNRGATHSPFTENAASYDSWFYGDVRIVPNGPDNLFPQRFKTLLDKDNIAPGIIRQKIDLMLTGGHVVYTDKIANNEIIKTPVIDNQINDWLESFGFFENYLLPATTDFVYIENCAAHLVNNEAWKFRGNFGKPQIAAVNHIPIEDVRMQWKPYSPLAHKPDFYYVADWLYPTNITEYPAFDSRNPFTAESSIKFIKMPSFCSRFYGRPPFIGIANYIDLKVLILNWSKDNLKNSGFKYHIQSPLSYWQNLKETNGWTQEQLDEYEDEVLEEMDAFLSSQTAENAAKRFHTKFALPEFGKNVEGWKIDVLQDNTKQNSEAYISASSHYNEGTIAALHLDPSLSNVQITGKLSSGLDKLIAFNIHQLVSTPTPRKLILSAVNEAIRINFWTNDYRPKVGFPDIQLDYLQKTKTDAQLTNTANNETGAN